MMRLIVTVLLGMVAVLTRKGGGPSPPHQYLGFVLVSLGALIWAGSFDALAPVKDVVTDADPYPRVILWSVVGVLLSVGGLIASLWCHEKVLRVSTRLVGAASTVMCAVNILVPY